MTNELSLLVKPVGGACDLSCGYCFYRPIAEARGDGCGVMSDQTVLTLLDRIFSRRPCAVSIAFQGGEPTLAGIDWYRRFLKQMEVKNRDNVPVSLSIQTNGTQIDDVWAAFLHAHGFLIGLSLDGDRATNDRFRKDMDGRSVFDRVLKASRTLSLHGAQCNVLSVVTDESAYEIERTYAFFKSLGFRYLQFIPLVNTDAGPTLGTEAYAYFLKRSFDLWYDDFMRGDYVSVRHIDNYVRILLDDQPENCAMRGVCGVYYVIEADGSVYPCDFYCQKAYRLGSVFDETPFGENEKHMAFLADSYKIRAGCGGCRYAVLCRGGCRRDRTDELTKNKYCAAYRSFFDDALPRLQTVARNLIGHT